MDFFERDVTTVNGDVIKCRKIDQLEYSVMATTQVINWYEKMESLSIS